MWQHFIYGYNVAAQNWIKVSQPDWSEEMRDEALLKVSQSFVTSLDDTVTLMCLRRPRRSTWTFPGLPFMHFWIETSLMNAFVSVISLVISSWGINSYFSISRPNLLTVSLEHNSTCSRNIWLLWHDGNRIMGDIVALMEPITIVISPNVTKNAKTLV